MLVPKTKETPIERPVGRVLYVINNKNNKTFLQRSGNPQRTLLTRIRCMDEQIKQTFLNKCNKQQYKNLQEPYMNDRGTFCLGIL